MRAALVLVADVQRSFASDNNAPVAPEIIQAIVAANVGDEPAYGADRATASATARLRAALGERVDVYFAFNGTGANVTALSCLLQRHEAVLCASCAHLRTDECGAFERFTGCQVLSVDHVDGKIRPSDIAPFLTGGHDEHHAVPRVLSISQSTEFGAVYSIGELRELIAFAHERGLYVHVDGARIANAAAALGVTVREITADVGADVLSFGGTKNGLMYGEAIVFFRAELHRGFAKFARKQAMQLGSKMRYIAAQFDALLQEDRLYRYAAHANAMARRLADAVRGTPGVEITRPVEANAVFATLRRPAIEALQRDFFFYVFDENRDEVRWMTHHATSPDDVDRFARAIRDVTAVAAPAG